MLMLREIGIRRALATFGVAIVATIVLFLLTRNDVIAAYGSVLLAGLVFLYLFGRADDRGEIHWRE